MLFIFVGEEVMEEEVMEEEVMSSGMDGGEQNNATKRPSRCRPSLLAFTKKICSSVVRCWLIYSRLESVWAVSLSGVEASQTPWSSSPEPLFVPQTDCSSRGKKEKKKKTLKKKSWGVRRCKATRWQYTWCNGVNTTTIPHRQNSNVNFFYICNKIIPT